MFVSKLNAKKINVFWDIAPCSVADIHRRLRGDLMTVVDSSEVS